MSVDAPADVSADAPDDVSLDAESDAAADATIDGDDASDVLTDTALDAPTRICLSPDGGAPPTDEYLVATGFEGTVTLGSQTFTSGASGTARNTWVAWVRGDGSVRAAATTTSAVEVLPTVAMARDGYGYVGYHATAAAQTEVLFAGADGMVQRRDLLGGRAWLVQYDATGVIRWVRSFGETTTDVYGMYILSVVPGGGRLQVTGQGSRVSWPQPAYMELAGEPLAPGVPYTATGTLDFGWTIPLHASTGEGIASGLSVTAGTGCIPMDGGGCVSTAGSISPDAASSGQLGPLGEFVQAGDSWLTDVVRYAVNHNTAQPTEILPAPLDWDGWVAALRPVLATGANEVRWAYRVGSPNAYDSVATAEMVAGGDVVASGWTSSDVARLSHGSGETLVDVAPAQTAAMAAFGNSWLARWAADGQAIVWARAITSADAFVSVQRTVTDEARGLFFVAGTADGPTTFGRGEASGRTFAYPAGTPWGFVARFALTSGDLDWVAPLESPRRIRFSVAERSGDAVAVYMTFLDAITFDPAGPAELALTAPGHLVHGIARYSLEGCFLGFHEVSRSVTDWLSATYPVAARLR